MALALCLAPAKAGIVGTYETKAVTDIFVFTGTGDVIFRVATPAVEVGCENGFWLRPSEPGYNTTLDILILVKNKGLSIKVWGYDNDLWPGSTTSTCRLYLLSPT